MKKILLFILLCCPTIKASSISVPNYAQKNVRKEKIKYDEGNKVKFTLGNKTFDLQSYNLTYNPGSNDKTSTNIGYQTTSLNVSIKSSKIDQELLDWILDINQQPKTAEINVYEEESGKLLKTLSFTGITTGYYTDSYNGNNNYIIVNQYTNLTFRYKTLSIKLK